VLLVDPRRGNDTLASGSQKAPFKTITQALKKVVRPNAVIQLAAGTYSAQTGETFPIRLKPNVTIQGNSRNRGQGIVIQGGGRFVSPTSAVQNIAILGANQAQLIGVTVSNLNRRGYGLWIESTNTVVINNTFTTNKHDGISVVGSGAPTIRSNYFSGNGANGLTIYGTARPEVRENVFDNNGFGVNVNQQAIPILIGNRITRNKDGIVVQASAQPFLRNNIIENNSRDGLVAIAQSLPDLGTANQPGNNIFRNNGRYGIHNAVKNQTIAAFGNQVSGDRTAGQIDFTNTAVRPTLANRPALSSSQVPHSSSENFAIEIPVEVVSSTETTKSPTLAARPPAISIPTAPSRTTQPTRSSQTSSTQTRPLQETTVIEIPVPPPISATPKATPTVLTPPPLSNSGSVNLGGISSNLLPVPNAPIPLGNPGSSPAVFVARGTLSSTPGSPPPPPLKVISLGPRFRVVVEAKDSDQQAQIRSLVPDAFRSSYRGRAVIQVGSFKERAKADEIIHLMTNNGFDPIIESSQ
jgi:parallel beta-helix repeat protein